MTRGECGKTDQDNLVSFILFMSSLSSVKDRHFNFEDGRLYFSVRKENRSEFFSLLTGLIKCKEIHIDCLNCL